MLHRILMIKIIKLQIKVFIKVVIYIYNLNKLGIIEMTNGSAYSTQLCNRN
jgi:hypothetical protein